MYCFLLLIYITMAVNLAMFLLPVVLVLTTMIPTLWCRADSVVAIVSRPARPDWRDKAATARWMVHTIDYGVLSTISSRFVDENLCRWQQRHRHAVFLWNVHGPIVH
jgi:hypothetical protein